MGFLVFAPFQTDPQGLEHRETVWEGHSAGVSPLIKAGEIHLVPQMLPGLDETGSVFVYEVGDYVQCQRV